MKKNFFIIVLFLILASVRVYGVRAYPHPKTIVQPDGTSLTIVGHGDEFQHYVTTTDGYTVLKASDGVFRYAIKENGKLKPSGIKAADISARSIMEKNFLCSIEKDLKPSVSGIGKKLMNLSMRNDGIFSRNPGGMFSKKVAGSNEPSSSYRGLVILVNFTDRKFSRGDAARGMVDDMMNKPGYTYYNDPLLGGSIECTGSVHDYFYDNSDGQFLAEFDVVGPIELDVDQYYIDGTERTYELSQKVLEAADSELDYSRYDSDGDGIVDMFYIIYAGYSSVYQGNDERLVWPHAGHFEDYDKELVLDNMRFGRFASSSEIYGWEAYHDMYLDGIGVIVHEFSHILGFKDHYDVSGYLNEDPGSWDVMASGNYNGVLNDTPCGYNSYERYSAGFITPRTVTEEDDNALVSLRSLLTHKDALRIKSTQDSTVFMLENRQLEKWDKHLPGHGMLVWRVDSCDNEYWEHNALNVNGRLHFKLIRATGPTINLFREIDDMDYDPFPGTRNVTELTNYTRESDLLTDKGFPSPMMIREIKEENDLISFKLEKDPYASDRPYTFRLNNEYEASGVTEDGDSKNWTVHTGVVQTGGRDRNMIYDLVPDDRNISASDSKYSSGLGAAYALSENRDRVLIEPYRVALLEDYGVWLVDFNDLDNGGSGAIVLSMTPFGELALYNPESVLGYCLLPKTSPLVIADDIVERFSMVRDIRFTMPSGVNLVVESGEYLPSDGAIYNLQGIKVDNPLKGEIYIIGGKKVRYL